MSGDVIKESVRRVSPSRPTVTGPYGVIPLPKVSRLNDDEMKRLMIDVVDRTYHFIHTLFDENTGGQVLLRLAERDPLPHWKEPTLRDDCDQQLRTVGCLRNVGTNAERRGASVGPAVFGPSCAIHRRYTEQPLLCVPYGSLQGVTVRPVPCNYYVIQQDGALSRR